MMTDKSPQGPIHREIPDGDNRERLVCQDCGFINYVNPKIVAGAVVLYEDKILLCKRAIDPRSGYWTLPAGFMEERETVPEGAMREAMEEANAQIEIDALLGVYNIPRISQVQMIYRARLLDPNVWAGPESEEVALYRWEDIPWDDLAFPSVVWALNHWRQTRDQKSFPPFSEPEQGL